MEFKVIKEALQKHFNEMQNTFSSLLVMNLEKDKLWETYLSAFSEEDNPVFRKRTVHDCACCRHFIKNIGNVVGVRDGKIISIWDFRVEDSKWQKVADAMSAYVKENGEIAEVFLSKYPFAGVDKNFDRDEDGNPETFYHFYVDLNEKFVFNDRYSTINTEKGQQRDIRNVFHRSLSEISIEAVQTVMDLIRQGSLYKGDEWKEPMKRFLSYKERFDKLQSVEAKQLFAWEFFKEAGPVVGKIRNHSLGTLLVNITNGEDLDSAVRKYEEIVAPQNYKRSTPVVCMAVVNDKRADDDYDFALVYDRRFPADRPQAVQKTFTAGSGGYLCFRAPYSGGAYL